MKKLIVLAILLAVIIYFGYPYLEQLGHPEEAIPGFSEWLENANEKIHVTVDGAKNLYVQGQKIKELIDIASWDEIEKPQEGTEKSILSMTVGEGYTLTIFNGFAGVQGKDGEMKYYQMDPDTFRNIKDFIQENYQNNPS